MSLVIDTVDDLYGLPIRRVAGVDELAFGDEPAIYHVGTGFVHDGDEIVVPLLVRPRRTREVVFGLHGSVGRVVGSGRAFRWPLFERVTQSAEWPWSTVLVADPTLLLVPDLNLGWYLGKPGFDLEAVLNRIFSKAAALLGADRLIFHGGSGGGFAALKHSTYFRDSLAFAFNPQTELMKYEAGQVLHALTNLFPVSDPETFLVHSRKFSLKSYYQHPLQNFVYYIQNAGDWHVEEHADPLMKFIRERPANFHVDRVIYVLEYNGMGHDPPPAEVLDDHLRFAIRRFFR